MRRCAQEAAPAWGRGRWRREQALGTGLGQEVERQKPGERRDKKERVGEIGDAIMEYQCRSVWGRVQREREREREREEVEGVKKQLKGSEETQWRWRETEEKGGERGQK